MSKRRKAIAIEAPQSLAEAKAELVRYADLESKILAIEALKASAIAAAESRATAAIAAIEPQLTGIFKALATFWATHGEQLTAGKRRSIELAGVTIGQRTSTPALKLPKGMKPAEMIAKLLAAKRGELVRTKYELEKPAILKLLAPTEPDAALVALGLVRSTKDEFFISTGPAEQPADMDAKEQDQ